MQAHNASEWPQTSSSRVEALTGIDSKPPGICVLKVQDDAMLLNLFQRAVPRHSNTRQDHRMQYESLTF